jgi:hypothetical protein
MPLPAEILITPVADHVIVLVMSLEVILTPLPPTKVTVSLIVVEFTICDPVTLILPNPIPPVVTTTTLGVSVTVTGAAPNVTLIGSGAGGAGKGIGPGTGRGGAGGAGAGTGAGE